MPNVSTNRLFRASLRKELPLWRAEGIIDGPTEQALSARYALEDADSAGLAIAALYVLAAALVAGGIVSLVAWHWDELSRWTRLGLLGVTLVAAHAIGYRMWLVTRRRPRLGHAISLLGTLVFGASIGLVAQIFQVSGVWYGAFGAWALGALGAGLLLSSVPTLCVAAFLALLVWGPGFVADHGRIGDLVAWGIGGGSLALLFRFRSRVLLLIALTGLGTLLAVAAAHLHADGAATSSDAPLAAVLVLAAAACAFAAAPPGAVAGLAPTAAWAGRLALYGAAYMISFQDVAKGTVEHPGGWTRAWLTCVVPPLVAAAAFLGRARPVTSPPLRATAIAGIVYSAAYVLLLTLARAIPLAVSANVVLLVIAGAWVLHGLRSRSRASFWEGLAIASIVAISRFFEIESLLWLKGAGFIAAGIGVVLAALAFERRLATEASNA